ncbi:hypothetical protein CVT24_013326 [Panaeolus cyanescens]|uniref:Calcineurin-like phosphoesterase domain-containing protein n=1 Tax=Panaeolus cyanescens TaxID=181874 RepID=A0A409WD97_9AGAR|nr:hypothetical protein CVT24_013326 [Panaeolus cyanescens]
MDALFDRPPLTSWERFIKSPLLFLAKSVYAPNYQSPEQTLNNPPDPPNKIRIVCISDTHNTHANQPVLPEGDILIHSGDLTVSGTTTELHNALSWLASQPHKHKIFIAGNHDSCLADPETVRLISSNYPNLTYLCESSENVAIRGRSLLIYGAPYTPKHGTFLFQYPKIQPRLYSPENELESTQIWNRIPLSVDVLVTHGPPFGHLDLGMGCYPLLTVIRRVRPKAHIFGHIHASRGMEVVRWDSSTSTYEEICAGRLGWMGLLRLVYWKVCSAIWRTVASSTFMVNAASVAGLRDNILKGAIVLDI